MEAVRHLGNLDLQVVRGREVVRGDAEAARGDLFDCRPKRIRASIYRLEAAAVLSSFTTVALTTH
jgi:hypothetical protein